MCEHASLVIACVLSRQVIVGLAVQSSVQVVWQC